MWIQKENLIKRRGEGGRRRFAEKYFLPLLIKTMNKIHSRFQVIDFVVAKNGKLIMKLQN